MKKVFKLIDEKKNKDRIVESMKNDIRKYAKREKKKDLPEKSTMYWDFDCKVGATQADAKVVKFETLIKSLDLLIATGIESCYVEILAKAVNKPLKIESEEE